METKDRIEHFEKEEARLLKELEEAKKRFDQKYAR